MVIHAGVLKKLEIYYYYYIFQYKINNNLQIYKLNIATCGGKTNENAHPHLDTNERIALVHNGTLDNYKELKDELLKNEKIVMRSETDTEVIA